MNMPLPYCFIGGSGKPSRGSLVFIVSSLADAGQAVNQGKCSLMCRAPSPFEIVCIHRTFSFQWQSRA
jgi:hypothetical protein